ncbi:MAG: tape measure protein [Fibrobacter sp.]|nr:tape measure protein [Fibrobacter sp.]
MSQKVQVILEVTSKGMDQFSKASGALDKFQTKAATAIKGLISLPNVIAAGAVAGIVTSFNRAGMELDALQNRLNAAIGKFTSTSEEMKYLRSEADRTGQNFRTLTDSYAGFSAATTRAGISVEDTREIFKNFNETSISLKLSNEKTRLVFMALEQMASKGKVSMEELRRQLGDALPGALEIAAKSMGMTTSEFNKAVSNGEIMAADFLPKFAKAVREELGGSFDTASKGMRASLNRMQNAWFDFQSALGQAFSNDQISLIDGFTSALKKVNENMGAVVATVHLLITPVVILWNAFQIAADLIVASCMYIYRISKIVFIQVAGWVNILVESLYALGDAVNAVKFGNFDVLPDLKDSFEKIKERFNKIGVDTKHEFKELSAIYEESGRLFDKNISDVADQIAEAVIAVQKAGDKAKEAVPSRKYQSVPSGAGGAGAPGSYKLKNQSMFDSIMSGQMLANAQTGSAWGTAVLGDMEKYYDGVFNRLMLKIGDLSEKAKTSTELLADRMKDIWTEFTDSLEGKFKGMYDTLTDLNSTWNEKLVSIGQQAYKAMTDLLWQYLSAYVKAKMVEGTVGIATEKQKQIEGYKTAAADGAGAAAGAGKAVSNIPYVGPILAVAAIATVFAAITALISKAKKYAIGTSYAPPGYAWVGERGPELMRMRGGEQIIPADKSARMGGGVNINLTVNGNMDKQTADYTVNRLRRFADDYNNAMRYKYLNPGLARY